MKTKICIKIIFIFLFGYASGISPECQNTPINDPKYENTLFWLMFPNDQRNESDRERASYIVEQLLCELPVNAQFGYSFGYFMQNNGPYSNTNRIFSNVIHINYPRVDQSGNLCDKLIEGLNHYKAKEPSYNPIIFIFLFPAADNCSIYESFKNKKFSKKYSFFGIHFDNTKSDDYVSLNIQHLRNFDINQKIAIPPLVQEIKEFARQILGLEEEKPPAPHEEHWTDHLWAPLYILMYLAANIGLVVFMICIISCVSRRK
ncbi:unnamed protein product [Caenorhabditis angaria]|uniref:Uncharacterized protein n=1 Tax=Caenorhabditis angaria TaxID=860376 RepID=A0A9P1IZ61_9PELO|nr:unnamed protein product [Caenorhabditis angaria]